MAAKKICVFPGDGIGPEVVREGISVLRIIEQAAGKQMFETEEELLGGASYDAHGVPMAPNALALAKASDAVLLGAVGGPKWDPLPFAVRPERALLGLRKELGLFATLRRAGILQSQRGVKGGYSFAREPSDITVLEIVELLDGKLGAGAESIFSEAAEAARAVLSTATIADIVERENRDAGATMYYI